MEERNRQDRLLFFLPSAPKEYRPVSFDTVMRSCASISMYGVLVFLCECDSCLRRQPLQTNDGPILAVLWPDNVRCRTLATLVIDNTKQAIALLRMMLKTFSNFANSMTNKTRLWYVPWVVRKEREGWLLVSIGVTLLCHCLRYIALRRLSRNYVCLM